MTGKLYELPPPPGDVPDEDILRLCDMLLQMAKNGELRAVGVAMERMDGTPSIALAYGHNTSICLMLGAIDKLHNRVDQLSGQDEDDEDDDE